MLEYTPNVRSAYTQAGDRQAGRQVDRQAGRQACRKSCRKAGENDNKQANTYDKWTSRQAGRQSIQQPCKMQNIGRYGKYSRNKE